MTASGPSPSARKEVGQRKGARRRLFMLTTVFVSCLISALILEVSCRVLGYGPAPPVTPRPISPQDLHSEAWLREAQLKRWIHPPHQVTEVKTDEHAAGTIVVRRNDCGFREDTSTPIVKPDGVFRILVLGDSHTDGVCFNAESYANRLEAALNVAELGLQFDVINAGQVTFSPYQEWWLYEKVGRRFSPDLVVVGMYAGNDYWDLMQRRDRVHLEPYGDGFQHREPTILSASSGDAPSAAMLDAEPSFGLNLKNFLRDHCSTYHAIASVDSLRAVFGNPPRYSPLELRIQKLEPSAHAAYWQSLGQAAYFAAAPADLAVADAAWRCTVKLFQSSADRDGVEVLFMVIPSLQEVDAEADSNGIASAIGTLQLTQEQALLSSRVRAMAVNVVREEGHQVIDLFDELVVSRKTQPKLRLFYRFDHHLAPDGQSVVAGVLSNYLVEHISRKRHLQRESKLESDQ